jgi:hypothetical protein
MYHLLPKQVISITYSERGFVALDIQHAKYMCCSLLSSVVFRPYSIFRHYLVKAPFPEKYLCNII